MPHDDPLIQKLEAWVSEHPHDADVPHINITTQREFTLRGLLTQLIRERDTRSVVLDDDMKKVKNEVADWLRR